MAAACDSVQVVPGIVVLGNDRFYPYRGACTRSVPDLGVPESVGTRQAERVIHARMITTRFGTGGFLATECRTLKLENSRLRATSNVSLLCTG
jgi:hypothetical protein